MQNETAVDWLRCRLTFRFEKLGDEIQIDDRTHFEGSESDIAFGALVWAAVAAAENIDKNIRETELDKWAFDIEAALEKGNGIEAMGTNASTQTRECIPKIFWSKSSGEKEQQVCFTELKESKAAQENKDWEWLDVRVKLDGIIDLWPEIWIGSFRGQYPELDESRSRFEVTEAVSFLAYGALVNSEELHWQILHNSKILSPDPALERAISLLLESAQNGDIEIMGIPSNARDMNDNPRLLGSNQIIPRHDFGGAAQIELSHNTLIHLDADRRPIGPEYSNLTISKSDIQKMQARINPSYPQKATAGRPPDVRLAAEAIAKGLGWGDPPIKPKGMTWDTVKAELEEAATKADCKYRTFGISTVKSALGSAPPSKKPTSKP